MATNKVTNPSQNCYFQNLLLHIIKKMLAPFPNYTLHQAGSTDFCEILFVISNATIIKHTYALNYIKKKQLFLKYFHWKSKTSY